MRERLLVILLMFVSVIDSVHINKPDLQLKGNISAVLLDDVRAIQHC